MNEQCTFSQNPDIDLLFGTIGVSVPSKKEDFKPIDAVLIDKEGVEQILKDFYVKKPSSKSVCDFENLIAKLISDPYYAEKKILKPQLVEVAISVSINKRRFFQVDVDNMAKTVLDSLKGHLFEDDSQVAKLICEKHIHPMNVNSFLIAITQLTDKRQGLMGDKFLFSRIQYRSDFTYFI